MIRYLLIKLHIICPRCGEQFWTFTYGKPRKCGCS
jgi:ribosomal protein L37E